MRQEKEKEDEDEEPACDNQPVQRKSVSCYRRREAEEGCGELNERVQRVCKRQRWQRPERVNLRARARQDACEDQDTWVEIGSFLCS